MKIHLIFDGKTSILFFLLIIIVTPLFPLTFSEMFRREEGVIVTALFIVLFLIIAIVNRFIISLGRGGVVDAEFTMMDVFIVAYLMYLTLHLMFVCNIHHEPVFIIKGICLIIGYIPTRYLTSPKLLLVSLVVSGFIQSLICLVQLSGLLESSHPHFSITGTFMNPGQLGGFLAISMIASFGLILITDRKKKGIVAVASMFIIVALFFVRLP